MIIYLKHIAIEGSGLAEDSLPSPSRILELQNGDSLPENLSEVEAVIVLGGPMNVYEEDKNPFLKAENKFIKQVIDKGIPLLGICLGSQLIAKACGAKVKKSPIKEIGWREVVLTAEGKRDPLFKDVGAIHESPLQKRSIQVFQWHEDTFDIPEGGVLLATSSDCPNQAFRIGKNTYGLQFHVEVTDNIIESWIKEYFKIQEACQDPRGKKMLEEYQTVKQQFHRQAEGIFCNFANMIIRKDNS